MNQREKEKVSRQHDLEKWAEQTGQGKFILIWKFFMAGNEIAGWELVKVAVRDYNDRRSVIYMWRKPDSDAERLIRIDIVECGSWRKSHETLLKHLVECQAPQLPEATSKKIEIGDIAFIGFGETVQSAVFARANMVVSIHSVGKQDVSIIDTARRVDELFVSKPRLSEKGVIPEIEAFVSERGVIKRDEMIALDIRAKDPLDRPLWYRFEVDQGELSVKDGKVYFSSKAPGRPEISLFAVNENGFVAGTTLCINVE